MWHVCVTLPAHVEVRTPEDAVPASDANALRRDAGVLDRTVSPHAAARTYALSDALRRGAWLVDVITPDGTPVTETLHCAVDPGAACEDERSRLRIEPRSYAAGQPAAYGHTYALAMRAPADYTAALAALLFLRLRLLSDGIVHVAGVSPIVLSTARPRASERGHGKTSTAIDTTQDDLPRVRTMPCEHAASAVVPATRVTEGTHTRTHVHLHNPRPLGATTCACVGVRMGGVACTCVCSPTCACVRARTSVSLVFVRGAPPLAVAVPHIGASHAGTNDALHPVPSQLLASGVPPFHRSWALTVTPQRVCVDVRATAATDAPASSQRAGSRVFSLAAGVCTGDGTHTHALTHLGGVVVTQQPAASRHAPPVVTAAASWGDPFRASITTRLSLSSNGSVTTDPSHILVYVVAHDPMGSTRPTVVAFAYVNLTSASERVAHALTAPTATPLASTASPTWQPSADALAAQTAVGMLSDAPDADINLVTGTAVLTREQYTNTRFVVVNARVYGGAPPVLPLDADSGSMLFAPSPAVSAVRGDLHSVSEADADVPAYLRLLQTGGVAHPDSKLLHGATLTLRLEASCINDALAAHELPSLSLSRRLSGRMPHVEPDSRRPLAAVAACCAIREWSEHLAGVDPSAFAQLVKSHVRLEVLPLLSLGWQGDAMLSPLPAPVLATVSERMLLHALGQGEQHELPWAAPSSSVGSDGGTADLGMPRLLQIVRCLGSAAVTPSTTATLFGTVAVTRGVSADAKPADGSLVYTPGLLPPGVLCSCLHVLQAICVQALGTAVELNAATPAAPRLPAFSSAHEQSVRALMVGVGSLMHWHHTLVHVLKHCASSRQLFGVSLDAEEALKNAAWHARAAAAMLTEQPALYVAVSVHRSLACAVLARLCASALQPAAWPFAAVLDRLHHELSDAALRLAAAAGELRLPGARLRDQLANAVMSSNGLSRSDLRELAFAAGGARILDTEQDVLDAMICGVLGAPSEADPVVTSVLSVAGARTGLHMSPSPSIPLRYTRLVARAAYSPVSNSAMTLCCVWLHQLQVLRGVAGKAMSTDRIDMVHIAASELETATGPEAAIVAAGVPLAWRMQLLHEATLCQLLGWSHVATTLHATKGDERQADPATMAVAALQRLCRAAAVLIHRLGTAVRAAGSQLASDHELESSVASAAACFQVACECLTSPSTAASAIRVGAAFTELCHEGLSALAASRSLSTSAAKAIARVFQLDSEDDSRITCHSVTAAAQLLALATDAASQGAADVDTHSVMLDIIRACAAVLGSEPVRRRCIEAVLGQPDMLGRHLMAALKQDASDAASEPETSVMLLQLVRAWLQSSSVPAHDAAGSAAVWPSGDVAALASTLISETRMHMLDTVLAACDALPADDASSVLTTLLDHVLDRLPRTGQPTASYAAGSIPAWITHAGALVGTLLACEQRHRRLGVVRAHSPELATRSVRASAGRTAGSRRNSLKSVAAAGMLSLHLRRWCLRIAAEACAAALDGNSHGTAVHAAAAACEVLRVAVQHSSLRASSDAQLSESVQSMVDVLQATRRLQPDALEAHGTTVAAGMLHLPAFTPPAAAALQSLCNTAIAIDEVTSSDSFLSLLLRALRWDAAWSAVGSPKSSNADWTAFAHVHSLHARVRQRQLRSVLDTVSKVTLNDAAIDSVMQHARALADSVAYVALSSTLCAEPMLAVGTLRGGLAEALIAVRSLVDASYRAATESVRASAPGRETRGPTAHTVRAHTSRALPDAASAQEAACSRECVYRCVEQLAQLERYCAVATAVAEDLCDTYATAYPVEVLAAVSPPTLAAVQDIIASAAADRGHTAFMRLFRALPGVLMPSVPPPLDEQYFAIARVVDNPDGGAHAAHWFVLRAPPDTTPDTVMDALRDAYPEYHVHAADAPAAVFETTAEVEGAQLACGTPTAPGSLVLAGVGVRSAYARRASLQPSANGGSQIVLGSRAATRAAASRAQLFVMPAVFGGICPGRSLTIMESQPVFAGGTPLMQVPGIAEAPFPARDASGYAMFHAWMTRDVTVRVQADAAPVIRRHALGPTGPCFLKGKFDIERHDPEVMIAASSDSAALRIDLLLADVSSVVSWHQLVPEPALRASIPPTLKSTLPLTAGALPSLWLSATAPVACVRIAPTAVAAACAQWSTALHVRLVRTLKWLHHVHVHPPGSQAGARRARASTTAAQARSSAPAAVHESSAVLLSPAVRLDVPAPLSSSSAAAPSPAAASLSVQDVVSRLTAVAGQSKAAASSELDVGVLGGGAQPSALDELPPTPSSAATGAREVVVGKLYGLEERDDEDMDDDDAHDDDGGGSAVSARTVSSGDDALLSMGSARSRAARQRIGLRVPAKSAPLPSTLSIVRRPTLRSLVEHRASSAARSSTPTDAPADVHTAIGLGGLLRPQLQRTPTGLLAVSAGGDVHSDSTRGGASSRAASVLAPHLAAAAEKDDSRLLQRPMQDPYRSARTSAVRSSKPTPVLAPAPACVLPGGVRATTSGDYKPSLDVMSIADVAHAYVDHGAVTNFLAAWRLRSLYTVPMELLPVAAALPMRVCVIASMPTAARVLHASTADILGALWSLGSGVRTARQVLVDYAEVKAVWAERSVTQLKRAFLRDQRARAEAGQDVSEEEVPNFAAQLSRRPHAVAVALEHALVRLLHEALQAVDAAARITAAMGAAVRAQGRSEEDEPGTQALRAQLVAMLDGLNAVFAGSPS